MGFGKTPRLSLAFPAAQWRSQPALAPLRRCAQRKLELGAYFFWRGHTADGLEHAPRCSWTGSAFHCERPLEMERRRGARQSEFSRSARSQFARRARVLHRRRSEEHTSELQSPDHLVCRLLLEKKKHKQRTVHKFSTLYLNSRSRP